MFPKNSTIDTPETCTGRASYSFNGQEKDNEITNVSGGNTTASYWEYDSRIGRRWNSDPVISAWQSNYACFSNNPIIKIDPNGDDDYYNKKGKKVGTDGKVGVVIVITDNKIAREMYKQYKKGHSVTDAEKTMNTSYMFTLPSYTIRQAVKNSEALSNVDGKHEEGGYAGVDVYNTEQIINTKAGAVVELTFESVFSLPQKAELQPLDAANTADVSKLSSDEIKWLWHIHPKDFIGRKVYSNEGEIKPQYKYFGQDPTQRDIDLMKLDLVGKVASDAIGIVVGACETPLFIDNKLQNTGYGQIHFYNSKGTFLSISKDCFYNATATGKSFKEEKKDEKNK